MLTREQFTKAIKFILEQQKKEEALSKALQGYCGDTDFTGFFTDINARVVNWLINVMQDDTKYSTISWWLWDCPQAGECEDDELCSIYLDDKTQIVIRTIDDLYDYLTSKPDEQVIQYAFDSQTNGVKFAINQIDLLAQDNTSTGNPGYEERNALLKLVRNRIQNTYMLETGADDPAPTTPVEGYHLLVKLNQEEES